MSSDDRFYLLEFRNRPVYWGDIGSLLRIQGLVVGGGGAMAVLMLPGIEFPSTAKEYKLTIEEWSDFIRRSDDPEILTNLPKKFQRKVRYEISGAVQQKVWAADGFECKYCGAQMGQALLTIDHFMPLELGGSNDVRNYITSCKPCNKDKGPANPVIWCEGRYAKGNKRCHYDRLVEYLKTRVIS